MKFGKVLVMGLVVMTGWQVFAADRNDWFRRESQLACRNDLTSLVINWDTSVSVVGPKEILVGGKNIIFVGSPLMMEILSEQNITRFYKQDQSLDVSLPWSIEEKKKTEQFILEALLNGENHTLACLYNTGIKFF